VPVLRQDRRASIRRRDLDVPEVPEGDCWRHLHAKHPSIRQRARRNQATSRGQEINVIDFSFHPRIWYRSVLISSSQLTTFVPVYSPASPHHLPRRACGVPAINVRFHPKANKEEADPLRQGHRGLPDERQSALSIRGKHSKHDPPGITESCERKRVGFLAGDYFTRSLDVFVFRPIGPGRRDIEWKILRITSEELFEMKSTAWALKRTSLRAEPGMVGQFLFAMASIPLYPWKRKSDAHDDLELGTRQRPAGF
jgi:hypothetical protein